jgi:LPS export ABC transporter permease LptF/LPS export ABC transporter permease LptG
VDVAWPAVLKPSGPFPRGIVWSPLVSTLDRYVIRETVAPFCLALGLFTFVVAVQPMLLQSQQLLAKGVPLPTVGLLLGLLLPSGLGVTIPMAFLSGLLMALGRLSGDREGVALLACGVSPLRLLRPVLLMAVVATGLTLYVMVELLPDGNQKYREVCYNLLAKQTQSDIKPREFYEKLPGKVLYVLDRRPEGGWAGVLLADTTQPDRPTIDVAQTGDIILDSTRREVTLVLHQATRYVPGDDPGTYETSRIDPESVTISADTLFGQPTYERGFPEMTIADLRARIAEVWKAGNIPSTEELYLQQKFSFPAACLVFALLGLAMGLHTRKEGKLASMVLGLGVVFIYYVFMTVATAWTKSHLIPPVLARWLPNIALAPIALGALWWRTRATGARMTLPWPDWRARVARLMTRPRDSGAAAPPAAAAAPRTVVVLRVPGLRLPRPRLLDLYVASRHVRVFALASTSLLALLYIGTIIDLSEKLFKGQATASMLAHYLWLSTPQFVYYIIPVATLVAVLTTIGGLTRTAELIVMRAGGVSLYRTAAPLVVLALVLSSFLFGLEEYVLAQSNRQAKALEDIIRDRPAHTIDVANHNWFAGRDGRIYYYAVFDIRRKALFGLSIFDTVTGPYRLARHTYVGRATFLSTTPGHPESGTWHAADGWTQQFSGSDAARAVRSTFATRDLGGLPVPTDFASSQVDADEMTFGELKDYITRLSHSGFSVAEQRVSLQNKIAFPFVTVVMTLIGIPFGVTMGRRGALYGIGLAIGLASAYWLLMVLFLAAGAATVLPAGLAAWAANILFATAASVMLLTVRT